MKGGRFVLSDTLERIFNKPSCFFPLRIESCQEGEGIIGGPNESPGARVECAPAHPIAGHNTRKLQMAAGKCTVHKLIAIKQYLLIFKGLLFKLHGPFPKEVYASLR